MQPIERDLLELIDWCLTYEGQNSTMNLHDKAQLLIDGLYAVRYVMEYKQKVELDEGDDTI